MPNNLPKKYILKYLTQLVSNDLSKTCNILLPWVQLLFQICRKIIRMLFHFKYDKFFPAILLTNVS